MEEQARYMHESVIDQLEAENKQLKAENQRLKEALDKCMKELKWIVEHNGYNTTYKLVTHIEQLLNGGE